MKAQSAIEYVIVASVAIAIIIPVFYYSLVYSADSVAVAQARDAVNSVAKAADYVYSLGKGSSTSVQIFLPQGTLNSSVNRNVIAFTIQTSSGVSEIFALTKSTVSGALPGTSGVYKIIVNMTDPNVTVSVG